MADVAAIYGKLLEQVHADWKKLSEGGEGKPAPTALDNAAAEQLRQELYGKQSPVRLDTADDARRHLDQGQRGKLRRFEAAISRLQGDHAGAPARAMVMIDKERPGDSHVFIRGNPGTRGDVAKRQFLSVLRPYVGGEPFKNGSGRLDLAKAIIHPDNPLTARVMVNRIWHHHFGVGIVPTTSDFGVRCETPSHPQLLDHLATTFKTGGGSIKQMHRLIMQSATYQQASDHRDDAAAADPENRLLWRFNRQRVEFEPLRDSMLAVNRRLDLAMFGRPVDLLKEPFVTRRAIYGLIDRQDLPGMLAMFDFANPDASQPHRPNTTVPQQNLFMMNSAFVVEQARHLIGTPAVKDAKSLEEKIIAMHRLVLTRDPEPQEIALAAEFIRSAAGGGEIDKGDVPALARYGQALMMSNEFVFVD
jgi:hypothetical protein